MCIWGAQEKEQRWNPAAFVSSLADATAGMENVSYSFRDVLKKWYQSCIQYIPLARMEKWLGTLQKGWLEIYSDIVCFFFNYLSGFFQTKRENILPEEKKQESEDVQTVFQTEEGREHEELGSQCPNMNNNKEIL